MLSQLSRRRFLKVSSASLAAAGVAPLVLRSDEKKAPPSERLRVGVIGVAAQGQYNWGEIAKVPSAEVVALCDVHETRIGPARKAFANATFDVDFRKMLDRKGLDAVVVATPDHIHAVATLAALRAGLHVYCEKPLTHTMHEARLVAQTAKKMNRVTQMGTQIHAGNNYRRVVEIIQSGAIGPVAEVHAWVNTSYGGGDRPKDSEPVLNGLHWDLWLGPAPERPFHHGAAADQRGTYLPFNWRKWWDFGGGALADMACHHVDLPFWALKLRHPTKAHAEGTKLSPETSAQQLTVRYEFPARGELPPVKLTWYDGGRRPPHFKEGTLPSWGNGVLFVGTKGMLLADYSKFKLLPEKEFAGFEPPKPTIPNSIGHHREWVEACLKGGPTTCNFDYSGALTEAVLLGNVSYRCGQPLEWDAAELKAKNAPESEKFIRKEYRKGWEI
jgi:predicted dehydrogenase